MAKPKSQRYRTIGSDRRTILKHSFTLHPSVIIENIRAGILGKSKGLNSYAILMHDVLVFSIYETIVLPIKERVQAESNLLGRLL